MAKQFFRGLAPSTGYVLEFQIPVRKITISAINNDLILTVGRQLWSAESFRVPKNTSVKIDFQSENCGKGVVSLILWTSGEPEVEYSISVDEYANVKAGDNSYFHQGVTNTVDAGDDSYLTKGVTNNE